MKREIDDESSNENDLWDNPFFKGQINQKNIISNIKNEACSDDDFYSVKDKNRRRSNRGIKNV